MVTDDEGIAARRLLEFRRRAQEGVLSRRQLRECLIGKHDIERMLRRRDLSRVHPRVYIDHTGPLTHRQREWAALLYAEPAALCWRLGDQGADVVHVAIAHERQVRSLPGLQIHRVRGYEAMLDGRRMPALDPAHDALCMAHAAATELGVVAILAAAVAADVSGARLRRAMELHPSLRRRRFVAALIDDVARGTHSVLEHGYLTRVERAHGLPSLRWQVERTSARGPERRDGEYEEFGLVVELDGRLNHDSWSAGARDAARDLDDLAAGRSVARLRYGQVFRDPCRTAERIGSALQARGWTGHATRCGSRCTVERNPGDPRRTTYAGRHPG